MKMEKKTVIKIAIIGAVLMVAVSFIGGYSIGYRQTIEENTTATDTTWFTITETKTVPSPPDTVVKTKMKIVRVPQVVTVTETDTLVDTVFVKLPYEQHFASLEDVADVWYSGFDAKIDSAKIHRQHTTEIIRQSKMEIQPRNMVMATAGATDASLGYLHRFGPVWIGANAGYTYEGQPMVRGTVGFQF